MAPEFVEEVGRAGSPRGCLLPEAVRTVQPRPAGQTEGGPSRGPPGRRAGRAWHCAAGGGTAFVLSWRPPRRAVPCMWMRSRRAPRPSPPPAAPGLAGAGGARVRRPPGSARLGRGRGLGCARSNEVRAWRCRAFGRGGGAFEARGGDLRGPRVECWGTRKGRPPAKLQPSLPSESRILGALCLPPERRVQQPAFLKEPCAGGGVGAATGAQKTPGCSGVGWGAGVSTCWFDPPHPAAFATPRSAGRRSSPG